MSSNQTPILSYGFRPFFFAALWAAVILPTFWVSIYFGYIKYHGSLFDPAHWHSHEMLFGFVPALFAGFLLTASASWGDQDPICGRKLLALILVWSAERVAMALPIPAIPAMVLGSMFLPVFTVILIRYLKESDKSRHIAHKFGIFIGCYTGAKALMLWGAFNRSPLLYIGQDLALNLLRLLMIVVSAKVLPFFIKSRFPKSSVSSKPSIQMAAIISATVLCIPIHSQTEWMQTLSLGFYGISLITSITLFFSWHPWKHAREPMIGVLMLAFSWIIINLVLEISVRVQPSLIFAHPNIHALTAGAIGLMGAGVMTRVILGHTGRKIKADTWITVAFLCIFVGAAIRVYVPIFQPENFLSSTHHASGYWTLGYLILAIRLSPAIFRRRSDEELP